MSKVALITGITGQDGAYLAEFLLKKDYVVHGLKRRTSLFNTDRIDHLYQDPHIDRAKFFLHFGDMTDSTNLVRLIQEIQPDEIYNLAAMSHVLPAMIRKFHEAKLKGNIPVELWGTGTPKREFLHVDDLGQAVLFALENKLGEHLYNVGTGVDLTIKGLAELIQSKVGHKGEIVWGNMKPDGTPRKLMDNSKIEAQGWSSSIQLKDGIESTYQWFKELQLKIREVQI